MLRRIGGNPSGFMALASAELYFVLVFKGMRPSLWQLNSDSNVTRVQSKVTDQAPCCIVSLSGPSLEIIVISRSPSSSPLSASFPPPPPEPCLPPQDASFSKVLLFLQLFLSLSQSLNVPCRIFSSNLEPKAILVSGKKKRKWNFPVLRIFL